MTTTTTKQQELTSALLRIKVALVSGADGLGGKRDAETWGLEPYQVSGPDKEQLRDDLKEVARWVEKAITLIRNGMS